MSTSNNKLHLPVVRVLPLQKTASVAPQKLIITKDKYYKNKDDEWDQEYYIIYNSYEYKS